ncbi:MAG: DNA primase [Thermoanaerobaculia bacterium]
METTYDINDDIKRQVIEGTDLVALIGATTGLKKAGRSWKGLCPFHGEKSPSFHVHPEKGFYFCFGCGAKGDAITFVRETERLEFPEAVAYLARLAGVTIPMRRSGTRVDRSKETRTSEALVAAARFFRLQLSGHAAGRALLARRGFADPDPEAYEAYGFGVAPDAWDGLKSALAATFPEEVLVEAGLLQKHPENGRIYDRFRNRLTIEIRDARGEVLGFGARAFGDDQPKYLNSPESPRFTKGRLLYGLDRAKEPIRKAESIILVEGFFDRIALERAGLPNAVASMGTSLTSNQADLLVRHAPTVIVAYDGDAPGRTAAWKAFALLLERNVNVKNLTLADDQDPDSFLASRGDQALREAVGAAEGILESLAAGVPQAGSDPGVRSSRVNEAAVILKTARDPVLRHELLSGFSRLVGLPLELLAPREGKKRTELAVHPSGGGTAPGELPEGEGRVLAILLAEWPQSAPLAGRLPPEIFMHPVARDILIAIKGLDPRGATLDFSWLQSHVEGDAGHIFARLLLEDPEISGLSPASSRASTEGGRGLGRLHKPLLQLQIRHLETRRAALQREIELLGNAGEPGRSEKSREKQQLAIEIARLMQELRKPSDQG